jgi:hypothetical protein
VLLLGVLAAARGAADVLQDGLRGDDNALAAFPGAEAEVDVVVGDAEVGLVETAELAVERGAREQARTGDGGDVARGVRQEEQAEVLRRLALEERVRQAASWRLRPMPRG